MSRLCAAALAASLLSLALPAAAVVPMEVYPECGSEPDRPDLCPVDLGEQWHLISYVRDEWKDQVRPEEWEIGSGCHADRAWARTVGEWDAIVAVMDSGISWKEDNVLRKHWLNAGELPLPQDAGGQDAGTYDLDGNGVFNIDDWADDPRVDPAAGVDDADDKIDPSDLIHGVWGPEWDGVDNDGNGYVDDISGWDFFWNDNDPYDEVDFLHGYWTTREVVAEGGDGGRIGVCPNCALLNLRVSDSFVADGNHYGAALLYATDIGAKAVCGVGATLTNSSYVQQVMDYAWEHGVVVSGGAADEAAFHLMFPGGNHHNLYVNNIRTNADEDADATSYLQFANCTNYGARLDIAAPATGCTSRAVPVVAGAGGLIWSAAMGADGVEPLDPPLSGNEAYQILIGTTDDVWVEESTGPGADPEMWPTREGWDAFTGYGRVNIRAAVDAVLEREIPPEADVLEPEWFVTLDPGQTESLDVVGYAAARRAGSFTWEVQIASGYEPHESEWTTVASGGPESSPVEGVLATIPLADFAVDVEAPVPPITVEMDIIERAMRAQIYAAWVRLVVTDDEGRTGRMQKQFHLQHDPDRLAGWPVDVGGSTEGSPALFDMDGDGDFEVVVATADGEVWVLDHTGAPLPGWPATAVDLIEDVDPDDPANHLDAPAYSSGAVSSEVHQAIISTPAVEDLDGDGEPEVVVGTLGGKLYVFGADGSVRPGFPVEMDFDHITAEPLTKLNNLDFGFFAAIALGDLDNDGDLEIVAAGMDQHVYVWHHDGEPLSGWPVRCQYVGASVGLQGDRIVSSPAIGDVDGDGWLEVVLGTNESINTSYSPLYVLHHDGNDHDGGPYLDPFPITMPGFYSETLPWVGEGSPASPALSDLDGDGDLEICSSGMTDWGGIYDHTGEKILILGHFEEDYGSGSNGRDDTTVIFTNSPSFADLDGDGIDEVIDGGIGIGYITSRAVDFKRIEFDHYVNVWDVEDGRMEYGFPQQVEGLQFFQNPAVADLDHDGKPELIEGSGEYILHAFDVDGETPAGWPKFVGEWIMGSPAVGDLDGDGYLEVVTSTRGGWVHAWHTKGHADTDVQWQSFHHDPANTGNRQTPLPAQAGPPEEPPGDDDDGCECRLSPAPAGGGIAVVLGMIGWLALRRRA